MITEADVTEFQGLYEKQFGTPIAKEAAFQKLTLLVRQMEIVYQPISTDQYKHYVNEDEACNESERPGKTC